jgi:hypothetical protein
MASQKAARPATVATVREPQKSVKAAKPDDFYATPSILKIQAAFVARRLGAIDPAMLSTLAALVFGEARQ